jgi:hypothetical protein
MRAAVWSGTVVVGLIGMLWLLEAPQSGAAQQGGVTAGPTPGQLLALSSDIGEGRQQITVIDPRVRAMSVYHIDHATGAITLKSVRNIEADLLLDEYNTDSPLPREIRAMLAR